MAFLFCQREIYIALSLYSVLIDMKIENQRMESNLWFYEENSTSGPPQMLWNIKVLKNELRIKHQNINFTINKWIIRFTKVW